MKRLLIAAVAAACLVVPAIGQEVTCEDFDEITVAFTDIGARVVLVPPENLPEVEEQFYDGSGDGDVTRAFIVAAAGQLLLGLEVDGCLQPPIFLGFAQETRLSGKGAFGRIGA